MNHSCSRLPYCPLFSFTLYKCHLLSNFLKYLYSSSHIAGASNPYLSVFCVCLLYLFLVLLTKLYSPEPGGAQAQDRSQELQVLLGLPHLSNPHSLNEKLVILLNARVCCHLFILLLRLNWDGAVSPYIAAHERTSFVRLVDVKVGEAEAKEREIFP